MNISHHKMCKKEILYIEILNFSKVLGSQFGNHLFRKSPTNEGGTPKNSYITEDFEQSDYYKSPSAHS